MPFRSQNEGSSRASSTVIVSEHERINGWQCPWHNLQFIAWFFLIAFGIGHFAVVVPCLNEEWRPAAYIIPAGLYIIHLFLHVMCLSIDPADPNIRTGSRGKASWFDRTEHKHVIENNHCYICQVDVFPHSKHCSACNKCVAEFDHHCKWLNNCIGGRNYRLFLGCVMSALTLSMVVFVINLYVLIGLLVQPETIQNNLGGEFRIFLAVHKFGLLAFLVVNCLLLMLAICLLGHLLGFHLYLIWHELTTYEFIVSGRNNKQSKRNLDIESGEKRPPKMLPIKNNKVSPSSPRAHKESTSPDITRQSVEVFKEVEPRIHVPKPQHQKDDSSIEAADEDDRKIEDDNDASSSGESLHPAAETPEATGRSASTVPPIGDMFSMSQMSQTSEGRISFNEVNVTPRTITSVRAEMQGGSSDSEEELIPVNQPVARRPESRAPPSPSVMSDSEGDTWGYKFQELKLETLNDRSRTPSPSPTNEHAKRKTKKGEDGKKKKKKRKLKNPLPEGHELPPLVSRRPLPLLPPPGEEEV